MGQYCADAKCFISPIVTSLARLAQLAMQLPFNQIIVC